MSGEAAKPRGVKIGEFVGHIVCNAYTRMYATNSQTNHYQSVVHSYPVLLLACTPRVLARGDINIKHVLKHVKRWVEKLVGLLVYIYNNISFLVGKAISNMLHLIILKF